MREKLNFEHVEREIKVTIWWAKSKINKITS